MDWDRLYRDTVWHMMPKAEPYSSRLAAFILDNRLPVSSWIADAKAMTRGFGWTDGIEGLAMLAAMLERSSAAMLPAHAIAGLVTDLVDLNRRDLAIRCRTHDGLMRLLPLGRLDATALARDMATVVVSDVIRGTDALDAAAVNRRRLPGSRIDLTGNEQRARIAPVCTMAIAVVSGVLSFDLLADEMTQRLAA